MTRVEAGQVSPHPPDPEEHQAADHGRAMDDPGKLRVLVVDDEPTLRSVITQVLRMDGYDVAEAPCAEDALELFRSSPFSLVITDIVMGHMSGLDLLREIRAIDHEAIVVIMTSHASLETATSALRDGAYDFLIKPFDDIVLVSALAERAKERHHLLARNRLLVTQLETYARELERVSTQLKQTADRDGLTGLYNHRYFHDALDAEIAVTQRQGHPLSLIFLDVDHFKLYNDSHGHQAGDEVLRNLAKVLTECAGAGSTCARYGGEEFSVILPGVDHRGALALAEDIRRGVENLCFAEGANTTERVTISLGVSSYPQDGQVGKLLIDRADEALYRAKQLGRNVVCS